MKLFEINARMRELMETVDEDGLISQEAMDELVELQMDAKEKVEHTACYIKELRAEADAIKAEADALAKRAKAANSRADGLENYLDHQMITLGFDKYYTARVALSYRKSQAVVIDNEAFIRMREKYLIAKEPTISLTAIKDDIKAGVHVPGAHIEERRHLQIK